MDEDVGGGGVDSEEQGWGGGGVEGTQKSLFRIDNLHTQSPCAKADLFVHTINQDFTGPQPLIRCYGKRARQGLSPQRVYNLGKGGRQGDKK